MTASPVRFLPPWTVAQYERATGRKYIPHPLSLEEREASQKEIDRICVNAWRRMRNADGA